MCHPLGCVFPVGGGGSYAPSQLSALGCLKFGVTQRPVACFSHGGLQWLCGCAAEQVPAPRAHCQPPFLPGVTSRSLGYNVPRRAKGVVA